MNNKGYTLIELLTSIIVLALIIILAVPAITSVSKAIKNRQRNNKIKNIEVAASKYAFDTDKTLIFVEELVKEGYLDADDEDDNIIDPVTKGRLNCYVVEMTEVMEHYNAKFIDGKDYDTNGVCDTNKLNINDNTITIRATKNGSTINTSTWQNGIITLSANGNGVTIDCSVDTCIWMSSSGANIPDVSSIILDNVSGLLETKYTFQVTKQNTDNTIKRYKSSIDLKIDNESPTIYTNETVVTNKFVNTSTKDVTIVASDGKGSGIMGYYLGYGSTINCDSVTYTTSSTFTINRNGYYTMCVKDKIGNISENNELLIEYIN